MDQFFIAVLIILAISILLPFYRVYRGPSVFDQVLSISAMGGKTIVLICLIGIAYGRIAFFIDIALTYAILNFVMTLAIARYIGRPSAQGEEK